jgi:hypothetical protein
MSGETVYLLEATPLNTSGVATSVNFSSGLLTEAELKNGKAYPVRLMQAYTHETSIFEENTPGQTSVSLGSATINNVDGRFDYLLDYSWDARPITIKRGKQGAAYATFVTEFVGSATEITADTNNLVLTLRDNSYKLAKPLQPNKYAATGGAEGGADLLQKFKPLLFGKVRNASPVWVDQVLLTWQIHDGTITSVDAVYDRGNKLTFYQNYSTYALLAAATIPPGYYATCLAAGFGRLGAPPAGTLTVDAVGAFGSVTNIPELVKQILTTRLGLTTGELDTAAFTQASTDFPYAFEGIYFPEPDLQYDELVETLAESANGFWYVTRAGLISFKIFKFSTPVATIRAEDIMSLGKAPSPKPLYRVKVNYGKNATIQPPSDFTIPKQLINAYLDKEYHHVDASVGTPDYSGAGKMNVFLNDQQVNDLGIATFSIPNGESWIAIDSTGAITVTSSGVASATATVRVNIGEYVWDESFTLVRDTVAPLQKMGLTLSADRFYFNDAGQPSPPGQTITATPSGLNTTNPITVTAVDNLGNTVLVSSNTISITNISTSPLVFWIAVTATDANGVKQTKRIMVQHGNDAYAEGILGSFASSGATFFFQATAPTTGMAVNDVWVDTDDANKTYRWTGTVWAAFSDTRIVDALTAAAGAQATADGKIKTYISTTTPTGTFAVGDLWWEPTSHVLKRWSGSSWVNFSATSLSELDPSASSTLVNQISDNVLSRDEKPSWIAWNAELESRYALVRARAVALNLSVSTLDLARTDWQNHLNGISPAWNDTKTDSIIYTTALPLAAQTFPSGWTLANSLSTSASGIYTVLNDAFTTEIGQINNSNARVSVGPGGSTSIGISVKKAAAAAPWAMLRNYMSDSSGTILSRLDVRFNPYTGAINVDTSGVAAGTNYAGAIYDLGTDWYVIAIMATAPAGTANSHAEIYPAAGPDSGGSFGGYATTPTGTISIKGVPDFVLGVSASLGRNMLIARLNTYSAQIEAMQKAVSETDAQLANQVTGPATFTAQYDSTGATALNLPANLNFKLQNQSGQITSGMTWKYVVVSGTVNGHAAGATEYTDTITADTGTGVFALNSMTGTTAKIEVRAYIGTMMWAFQSTITKTLADPPPGGGGSGGSSGGGALPQTVIVNTGIGSSTFIKIGQVTGTTGASQTSVSLSSNFTITDYSANKSDVVTVELKWMRSAIQKGSTGSGTASVVNYEPMDGSVSASGTDTGLTANTAYTWELWARCTAAGKSAGLDGSGTVT